MSRKKVCNALGIVLISLNMYVGATVKQNHVYCVILAGGSGERLWPLSRVGMPKQLLAVGEEKSLLSQAIAGSPVWCHHVISG